MKTTSELFNIPKSMVVAFKSMNYKDVIEYKVCAGTKLYKQLADQLHKAYAGELKLSREEFSLLNARLKELKDAIEHNEFFLKEMEL